jgi:hypothetical protein
MKKMSTKELLLFCILGIGFFLCFVLGFSYGMNRHAEIVKKVDCESRFRFEPFNTVTSECIKYFKE